ncbi:hypothetical protein BsWGS_26347 [Bradybaena similaris]
MVTSCTSVSCLITGKRPAHRIQLGCFRGAGCKIRRHFTDQLQLSGFTKHILIRTVIPRGMHPGLTDDVIFEGQAIEGAGGLMDDDYNGSEVDSVVPKCDIDAPPTPIRVTFNVGGVVFQTLEKTVKHVAKVSPTVKHMGKVSSQ